MNTLFDNIILSQDIFQNQLNYWKSKLGDEIREINIFDTAISTEKGKLFKHTLDAAASERLNKLANGSPIALYVAICAAFKVYLYKMTNSKQVTLLSPIMGNEKDCPYNECVMIYDELKKQDTYKDVLIKVKKSFVNAYNNQDYPVKMLLDAYQYEKAVTEVSDFSVQMNGLHSMDLTKNNSVKVAMTISAGEAISIQYEYNSSINKEEIQSFADRFAHVLSSCVQNYDKEIGKLQLLKEEEQNSILDLVNATSKSQILFQSVKDYIEETEKDFLNKVAVVTTSASITYSELNRKANQLARKLQSEGIEKGDIVGIGLNPSVELIISMLAVMKSGAAYLPIDLGIPAERLRYIIKDSNMKVLIFSKNLTNRGLDIENIIYFDKMEEAGLEEFSDQNLEVELSPEDALYIIYTSGTTGMPKGVKVLNRGVLNYIGWFKEYAGLTSKDRTMLTSSYAFDLGYTGLYSSLLGGCELSLLTKEEYTNPSFLLSYIAEHQITYMKTTPSFFRIISDHDKFQKGYFASMRLVLLGGENIDLADIMNAHIAYPDLVIANHYGPTETTIGVISTKIDFEQFEDYRKCPVLGKSITNAYAYVLNDDLNLMPLGCKGELYISGECVSGGYLNNDILTKERFLVNSYMPNYLLYKTGDFAKQFADGSIQFLGRTDNQVKIHGYRVEIGEIESALKLNDNVNDAVVMIRKDENGNHYICSYIVAYKELDITELRHFLSTYIADYMIPRFFIQLERIPLTVNGKIDYKALPEPAVVQSNVEYVAARNETEEQICKIWEEVLKCNKIGINDDFFALGGDSIKAIQVSSRLQNIGLKIELKNIIEHSTIAELVENMEELSLKRELAEEEKGTKAEVSDEALMEIQDYYCNFAEKLEVEEVYGLSPMQIVMYNNTVYGKGVTPYYHNRTLSVNSELDMNAVNKAFQLLIDQYQVLRTVYFDDSYGKIHQVSFKHRDGFVHFEDISNMNETEQKFYLDNEVRKDSLKGFNLKNDVLMRVAVYKRKEKGYFVLWSNHHMIIDGWSRMILIQKFFSNLHNVKMGNKAEISNVKFSNYIENIGKRDYGKALNYWTNFLEGYTSTALLKRKEDASFENGYAQDNVFFELNKEVTKHLNGIAASYKVTFNTLVLNMWGRLLQKMNKKDDVVFGSLVADRTIGVTDTDSSVGSFTNVIPVRMNSIGKSLEKEMSELQKKAMISHEFAYFAIEADDHFNYDNTFIENVVIFENYPIEDGLKQIYQGSEETIKDVTIFDQPHASLNLFVLPFETTLFKFSFNENIYSREYIESVANEFSKLLLSL